jgi:methyl-accepting chemotaxis protein
VVCDGQLSTPLPPSEYREFAPLEAHIQTLVGTLADMVEEANRTSQRVGTVQQEIVDSCNQQVAGAHEQSQAVSETSSAAAELSRSSEQIGANIQNISQMADHVLAGMEKIKVATDQTNRILTSLNEKSKQIGHITELIDDVADQTNLLAVNASIEAARAGEQGRGFTVVADQISKLADSTGKSTKDITALVEIIQHEMSNAIIAMEQSLTGVEEEIQLTKDSAAKSREIAMNANQQISGSRQIAEAMAKIDQTMKQIVTDAQQAAAQAGALSGVSEELRVCTKRYQVSGAAFGPKRPVGNHPSEADV